jgi:hypothetical protein
LRAPLLGVGGETGFDNRFADAPILGLQHRERLGNGNLPSKLHQQRGCRYGQINNPQQRQNGDNATYAGMTQA